MQSLNVYNKNEKCSNCHEKCVNFIVLEQEIEERLCLSCFKEKLKERK